MNDLRIDRVEVITLGPPTQRLTWALEQAGQYMTCVILKLTTKGGLVGLASAVSYGNHLYDLSVAEVLRDMIPELIGATPLERESIWHALQSKTLPRLPQALSLIDVALWDLAAKAAGLPLYRLLGGARDAVPAYASTPLLDSIDTYVEHVGELRSMGYRAIKFHCWCEPRRDTELVRQIAAAFPDNETAFMLDVEQRYTLDEALRVGKVLGELGYAWFEAPLDDYDLAGYRNLTAALSVDVIPAGNSIIDHRLIAFGLAQGCWNRIRIDVMVSGGITGALKIMNLAACHSIPVELQCWGYTLHQAANLHLMLAQPNCSYFEQPTFYHLFEYGVTQGIRAGSDGMVRAPDGPGLGISLDDKQIEVATIGKIERSERGELISRS